MIPRILALAGALCLAACGPKPDQPLPSPAIWQVEGPDGEKGWLFGTIHALPDGTEWRTPALEQVLEQAGILVVEVANLGDARAGPKAFSAVSSSPGLPPILTRVPPEARATLASAIERAGMDEADLVTTESWAAALLLANAGDGGESENSVDRALLAAGLPVVALEGYAGQFAIFDRLAEADQVVLLAEAAQGDSDAEEREQTDAWLQGDVAMLERATRTGFLTDPELRNALLTGRNRAWAQRVTTMLASHRRPLVAVGAAHMVGPEGMPALLAGKGYTVRRIQ
jgi:uncharacterized protein YbaP (TraB family)